MSGGNQNMVINTRERAVSNDINRLQAFDAKQLAEVLRRMVNLRGDQLGGGYWDDGSYVDTTGNDGAAIETPLRADVFDGLVVIPVNGSLNLLVSPGVIGVDDPDGQAGSSDPTAPSPDDSRYKLIVDPGIQVAGSLVLAAGAGSTRIDLVEVRRQTVVLETDSRDQFDPSTGTFTPVSVTKVKAGRLLYRVTQGTPGAGIPALSQGWLPICVVSVPSVATTTDGMTFWDVRPLVKDRINAPHESRRIVQFASDGRQWVYANDHTDVSKCTLTGVAMSAIGMYRCGGFLPLNASSIDVRAAANQAAGYTPGANKPWFLYAVFPAGLPRWVRYVPAPASPRVPTGMLGVICVSEQGPSSEFGIGDTLAPPVATGLVSTGPRALLCAGPIAAGPAERGFVMRDGYTHLDPNSAISGPAPFSTAGTTDKYALSPNAHFPSGATAVFVKIFVSFSGGTPGAIDLFHCTLNVIANDGSRLANAIDLELPFTYSGTGGASVNFTAWVPVPAFPDSNGEPDEVLRFQIEWSTITTRSGQACNVLGWKM